MTKVRTELKNLKRLCGSSPRQKLEICRKKLQRVLTDSKGNPDDVRAEAARLRDKITLLETELKGSYLPQAF